MLSIQVPFLNGLLYSKFVVLPKCLKMLSLLILLNCSEKYIILIPQIYFLKMYYITEKAESLFFALQKTGIRGGVLKTEKWGNS